MNTAMKKVEVELSDTELNQVNGGNGLISQMLVFTAKAVGGKPDGDSFLHHMFWSGAHYNDGTA